MPPYIGHLPSENHPKCFHFSPLPQFGTIKCYLCGVKRKQPNSISMDTNKFEQLTDYTSAGYALAKDFNCIFPCAYDWVPLREKVDQLMANPKA